MVDKNQRIEDVETEQMSLEQLTQVAINEAISYGHYLEHEQTGPGEFFVQYDSTGTTSILHQKLSEIGFHEDSDRTELDHEAGTKQIYFEYDPEEREK